MTLVTCKQERTHLTTQGEKLAHRGTSRATYSNKFLCCQHQAIVCVCVLCEKGGKSSREAAGLSLYSTVNLHPPPQPPLLPPPFLCRSRLISLICMCVRTLHTALYIKDTLILLSSGLAAACGCVWAVHFKKVGAHTDTQAHAQTSRSRSLF